jgi:hypothetical protein
MNFKRRLLLAALFILGLQEALVACDMCGCFMGVLPSDRRSFVGFHYRFRSFSGNSVEGNRLFPDGALKTMHDLDGTTVANDGYEIYRAVELRARYYLHQRLELNLVAPYLMNKDVTPTTKLAVSGIGDMTLMAGWQLLDDYEKGEFRHRLLLGAGIKLPSGNPNNTLEGFRYPLLIQSGTGSTDGLLYGTYQLGFRKWRLSLTPVYKINGTNRFEERIDNSKTLFGNIYYKIEPNDNLAILPAALVYYENTKGLYANDVFVGGTRMNTLMTGIGTDVFWKNFGFNIGVHVPVYEQENNSGLESRLRFMAGLTLFFDQEKFVFKSKEGS